MFMFNLAPRSSVDIKTLKSRLFTRKNPSSATTLRHRCFSGLAKTVKHYTELTSKIAKLNSSKSVALWRGSRNTALLRVAQQFILSKGRVWLMSNQFLGSVQRVPLSNRIHLIFRSDWLDNIVGSYIFEREAQENKGKILSPESPEAVPVARVLNEILQATNQGLGLQNDFQVSVYEPRDELIHLNKVKNEFKFLRKAISYHLNHPNKQVEKKPRRVRKLGLKYGTEHLDGLKWEVMVVDTYVSNAMYAPNGRIVFYTGYFRPYKHFTDADLAYVLAHEVGPGLDIPNVDKDFNMNIRKGIGAVTHAIHCFFSRRHELEADRIGMMLMAAAGYDPRLAPAFEDKHGNAKGDWPENIFSTHPDKEKRARELRKARVMKRAIDIYDQVRVGNQLKPII